MSYTDNLRDFCSDCRQKASEYAYEAKKKATKSKNYLNNKHGISVSGFKDRYDKYNTLVSSKTGGFKSKISKKWNDAWSNYVNYFAWSWAPWILAYGLIWSVGAWGLGLIEPNPKYIVGTGILWYGVRQELPELYHTFRGKSQIEG